MKYNILFLKFPMGLPMFHNQLSNLEVLVLSIQATLLLCSLLNQENELVKEKE